MTDDHATEAQKKKEEAARRLQEALRLKQQQTRPHQDAPGGHKPSGGFSGGFSPKPVRRGPRGG